MIAVLLTVPCLLDLLLLVVERRGDMVLLTGEFGKLAPGRDDGVKRVRLLFLCLSRASGDFDGGIFFDLGN